MKRVGGLFDRIPERKNLGAAFHRAALGRRHQPVVRDFAEDLDNRLARIVYALLDETYSFGDYQGFWIRDNKTRRIQAPPFEQRVVHHAIVNVTGPAFERGATDHSHACRSGKGHRSAIQTARNHTRTGEWFLKMDIEKYYDSVDHDLLLARLARRFREKRLVRLFTRLIRSYESSPGKGLPIGALTSQYLANFFLDPFDHWALEEFGIKRYARYMDDMVVWGPKDRLLQFREKAEGRFAAMGLRIKHDGEINACETGVPFLGFVLYPDRMRLNRVGRKRLRRKWHRLEKLFVLGEVDEPELQTRSVALFAWAAQGDDIAWRRSLAASTIYEGDVQGRSSRGPRRDVLGRSGELPVRVPQQEAAR